MREQAIIGIGTNLGDKIENIRRAIEAMISASKGNFGVLVMAATCRANCNL